MDKLNFENADSFGSDDFQNVCDENCGKRGSRGSCENFAIDESCENSKNLQNLKNTKNIKNP